MPLIIEDKKHYEDVVAFAKKHGRYDDTRKDNCTLKSRLDYLEKYGGENNASFRTRLFRDSAPASFYFVIEKKNDTGAWTRLFEGGLLYHGAHDGFGSGSGPTFAVTLTSTDGWSIHT
jgi:hypothetical protein